MQKNIYIIKNDINDLVYIGQTKDVCKRFLKHCSNTQSYGKIGEAIELYGKEHFWYEILEKNIENYDEREQYWIQYYNCIWPNGYNIQVGGHCLINLSKLSDIILSEEKIKNLTNDLLNSDMTFHKLAQKYNLSDVHIGAFNRGLIYAKEEIKYPIRKKKITRNKLSNNDIEDIIYILKYTYRSYNNIAEQFDVEWKVISRINKGKCYKQENEIYPIRQGNLTSNIAKLYYEQVTEIIKLLQENKLSMREIAKQFNCNISDIQHINNGKTKIYLRKNLIYPLRPIIKRK